MKSASLHVIRKLCCSEIFTLGKSKIKRETLPYQVFLHRLLYSNLLPGIDPAGKYIKGIPFIFSVIVI